MSGRPAIPPETQNRILYRNRWRCCVCREGCQVQIHHIDQNAENNEDANLAILCLLCHDKAHTKHTISKNLTADHIRDHKARWEAEIEEEGPRDMLPESLHESAVWTYINHDRIWAVLEAHGVLYDQTELKGYIDDKIVNCQGIPLRVIEPENGSSEPVTIYDRIPYQYRSLLMTMYSRAIGQLILAARPIDLRELTSSDQVQALVQPGSICFLHRGCRFRPETLRADFTQIRQASSSFAGFSVKFQVDTFLMYGSSSIHNSFAGHRHVTALLLTKNIGFENEKLVLHCTPLAMGTGFLNRRTSWLGPGDG